MNDEINFTERYDDLLEIKPSYGYERELPKIKFNYVGLEIEIAVNYDRENYSFIRTLLKKIKQAVGDNGYFVKDGTILGDYSFEIVLDPMSIKKTMTIYDTIMKIISFSNGTICFDKAHNCGLHINFNQYDIEDIEESHQRLLFLIHQKNKYFEENIYKRTYYKFSFKEYLDFQKKISDKYVAVNYLNKKLVEVRNIKTGLTKKALESIIIDIINALFPNKLPEVKDIKSTKKIKHIMGKLFEEYNKDKIKESLDNDVLIIKFNKKKAKIIKPTKKLIELLNESEEE